MSSIAEDILMHYGMPRRSGRWPWGSGEDPYQHGSRDFLSRVEELKKNGWEETPDNIMKEFGLTTTQYRTEKSLCKDVRRMHMVARAKSLRNDGLNDSEIGRIMGKNESSIRELFNEEREARMNQAFKTADFIRNQIETKGMIDVGKGVEIELNISKEKLNEALYILETEGYHVFNNRFEQATNPGQWTTQKVICPKDTPYTINDKGQKVSSKVYELDKIHPLNEDGYISHDGGDTFDKFVYPKGLDSKRVKVRYAEEGGEAKDGLVEIRRGIDDISLGNDRYSQVRIMVDNTHYIKGMAVYADD